MKKAKPTLLEQIKSVPCATRGRPRITEPDADTAIAWIKGEITPTQIAKGIWPGQKTSSLTTRVYLFLNMSIREAYSQGKIRFVE